MDSKNSTIPTMIENCRDGLEFKAPKLEFTIGTQEYSRKIDFYNTFRAISELCVYLFPRLTLQRGVWGLRLMILNYIKKEQINPWECY
jgi:hypothetical protein